LDLLIKVDEGGAMSQHIASLRPGIDTLDFKGPLGCNFPDLGIDSKSSKPVKRIALIAGGTGIAPMVQVCRFYTRTTPLHVEISKLD
jgi:NAD(P)H-flavin reductase